MPLPPTLLEAIAAPEGGRIVLVIGAGCSFEPPTGIPLARECSRDAHRKLLADGVLQDGDCADPDDLSVLADAVQAKTGRQSALVSRLPITQFKNATPNDGHLITAALMLEGAIANVVTLNFDLALSHALSQVAAKNEVSIVKGPEEHHRLGRANVIYLHRNVEADPEQWILTTEALAKAWRNNWEEVIARFATATPIIVFAGLGSSCGVLQDSIAKLRNALGSGSNVYLAGPDDIDDSLFADELKITARDYVQLGWVDLMRAFSERLILELANKIVRACDDLTYKEKWPNESVASLRDRLTALGLIAFGKLRAAWLLDDRTYLKMEEGHADLIADLLLAIGLIERIEGVAATMNSDGIVEFRSATHHWYVRVASGRGVRRWTSIETELLQREKYSATGTHSPRSRTVLIAGVTGPPRPVTPPVSILGDDDDDSIVGGDTHLTLLDVDQIRLDPTKIQEMFA
ncbi:MAG: hypothetical protein O3C40_17065 [Planctomycetota bacterium]|nr:hypothetical protein [Planctomycetota bacterium]